MKRDIKELAAMSAITFVLEYVLLQDMVLEDSLLARVEKAINSYDDSIDEDIQNLRDEIALKQLQINQNEKFSSSRVKQYEAEKQLAKLENGIVDEDFSSVEYLTEVLTAACEVLENKDN